MNKEFCTYDISLKLKELGFVNPCLAKYYEESTKQILCPNNQNYKKIGYFKTCSNYDYKEENKVAAPLWQEVINWLEIEHDIIFGFLPSIGAEYSHWGQECSEVHTYINGNLRYSPKNRTFHVSFWVKGEYSGTSYGYGSYYKVREYAILKALDIVETYQKALELAKLESLKTFEK